MGDIDQATAMAAATFPTDPSGPDFLFEFIAVLLPFVPVSAGD